MEPQSLYNIKYLNKNKYENRHVCITTEATFFQVPYCYLEVPVVFSQFRLNVSPYKPSLKCSPITFVQSPIASYSFIQLHIVFHFFFHTAEMEVFARQQTEPDFEFSVLQGVVSFILAFLVGFILWLSVWWPVGLGVGVAVLLLQYLFLGKYMYRVFVVFLV